MGMRKELTKAMQKGLLKLMTLKYYSADVEASWTIDDEDMADPSLQIVYQRDLANNGEKKEECFWLYLSPADAAAIGCILTAWARQHGETP